MNYCNTLFRAFTLVFLLFWGMGAYAQAPSPPTSNHVNATNGCATTFALSARTASAPSGLTHRWYTSVSGTQTVSPTVINTNGTSDYITQVVVSQTTEYWVAARSSSGQESSRTKVKVTFTTPNTTPPSLTLGWSGIPPCGPTATFDLGASGGGSGSTYEWYETSTTSGTPEHTGANYSPTLDYNNDTSNGSKTYWVKATLTSNNCYTGSNVIEIKDIVVSFKAPVTPPSVVNGSRCGPGEVTLQASGASSYRWYDPNDNLIVGETSATLVIPNLTTTSTYKVASYVGGCESAKRSVIASTTATPPIPPSVLGNSTRTICAGVTTNFEISEPETGWTYKWYEGSTELETGTLFSPSPTSSKTYTVEVTDDKGCTSSAKTLQVNVNSVSIPGDGSNENSCANQNSVQITAISDSGFAGEHVWYTSPGGNAETSKTISIVSTVGEYVTGITVSSGDQKDYWVAEKIGQCISNRRKVTATFNIASLVAGSINNTNPIICYNGNPPNIGSLGMPSGGNGTFTHQWQYSDDGVQWTNIASNGTSLSYNPPGNLADDRWYRRMDKSCSLEEPTNEVKVTVRDELNAGSINGGGQTFCQGSTIGTLGNESGAFGGNPNNRDYFWQVSNAQNGPWSAVAGATTSSYTPPATLGTKWYRRGVTSCNATEHTPAQSVTVTTVPLAPSASDVQRCGAGQVTFTASGFTNGQYRWYGPSGNLISNTSNELTRTLSSTKTYQVSAVINGCESPRTDVEATINALPGAPTGGTTPVPICGSVPVNIQLVPASGADEIRWYTSASGGTSFSATPSTSVTAAGQYYGASFNSATGCESTGRTLVEVVPTTMITWYPDADEDDYADSLDVNDSVQACEAPVGKWTSSTTLDNCLGVSSTNVVSQWYPDEDEDDFADTLDSAAKVDACEKPAGKWTTSTTLDNCLGNDTTNTVFTWYLDFDNDGHAVTTQSSCSNPGTGWTLTVLPVDDCNDDAPSPENDCGSGPGGTLNCSAPTVPNDPTDQNYIYTRNYQVPWSGDAPTSKFEIDDRYVQDISYFDGHGRPVQQIAIRQSPNEKDIIAHTGYDSYGRQDKNWLPFEDDSDHPLGRYRTSDMKQATKAYYKTAYADDFTGIDIQDINPYAQEQYEPSPLDRVEKQAAPGEDWKLGNGHEVEMEYTANAANEVREFKVTLDAAFVPTLSITGTYAARELSKTIVKDENHTGTSKNHTTETFTDKQGRVVLKRNYADGPLSAAEAHDTYYVYDDYGNLTYVFPPLLEGSTASLTQINADLAALGYTYRYDHRNRLVQKRIPGKDWEYMVYNTLDQPVMTQDANQRASGEWLFTKYDAFGRVAYTGKAIEMDGGNPKSRTQVQQAVNGITTTLWVDQGGSYTLNNEPVHYSNGAYPTTTISELLTVNYYDNYTDFTLPTGVPTAVTLLGKTETNSTKVRGLATASKVRVLDPTNNDLWITTVTYYDDKARPIYVHSANDYLQSVDITETELDFVGRPVQTKTTHTRALNGAEATSIVTIDRFTYDHTGRLLAQTQCIDGDCDGAGGAVQLDRSLSGIINTVEVAGRSFDVSAAELVPGAELYIDPNATITDGNQELIVYNEYDNLGLLKKKRVGGETATDLAQSAGLQQVDYQYNVLGWMKKTNMDTENDNDLFDFEIKYNDPQNGGQALYNGNISQTLWSTASTPNTPNPINTGYTYSYDALNRITKALDNTTNQNYSLDKVAYDKNGNITELERKGHLIAEPTVATDFGLMDDLAYAYQGNQLVDVTDTGVATGFFDGNTVGGNDYDYDANGNMIQDLNKGITSIEYNYLNLPTKVVLTANGKNGTIDYIYDATGTKLKKIATNTAESSLTVTEYCSGYIYEGNATTMTLQFFGQPEGYVTPSAVAGSYDYVYQYVDHLGNVRLSYTDKNQNTANGVALEIVEENNYYPFGLKHKGYNSTMSTEGNGAAQRWKFGGKEYMEDMDLDWYDVSARNYDPALGRWMNIDPLADQMRRHSPYNYAFDNPVFYIDPDGMEAYASNGYQDLDENEAWAQGVESTAFSDDGTITMKNLNSGKTVTMSSSDYRSTVLASTGWEEGGSIKGATGNLRFAKGASKEFKSKINDFITKIGSTELGHLVLYSVINSKGVTEINETDEVLNSVFIPEVTGNGKLTGTGNGKLFTSLKTRFLDGAVLTGITIFGHELWHAYQLKMGTETYLSLHTVRDEQHTKYGEVQAVGFENYLRVALDLTGSLRYNYSSRDNPMSLQGAIYSAPLNLYSKPGGFFGRSKWDREDFTSGGGFFIWTTLHYRALSKSKEK